MIRKLFKRFNPLPERVCTELAAERIVVLEEGLPGSVILRHLRTPTGRSRWMFGPIVASLIVTEARLAIYFRAKPVINVRFDEPRCATLTLEARRGKLIVAGDASLSNPRATGEMTVRVRCSDPAGALAQIQARQRRADR